MKSTFATFCIVMIILIISPQLSLVKADQIDIPGPAGSGIFGSRVAALPSGNIVVTDPDHDLSDPTVVNVGAVYLLDGLTGAIISVMTGSSAGDRVGSHGIAVLPNGNYLVRSASWDGPAVDVGAVTMCPGTTGCSGMVSAANSLTGSTAGDLIGLSDLRILADGNFVVRSSGWDGAAVDVGAVTWCNATTGCAGMVVSAENSLVGSSRGDNPGSHQIRTLADGNYVLATASWDDSTVPDVGAVTFCNGTMGCAGTISPTNSLIGSSNDDSVGQAGIAVLANGNFVVRSPAWGAAPFDHGAVTLCSGITGCSGIVSAANSLVGTANDRVGEVIPLANGNYVVSSSEWDGGSTNVGAVTLCSGTKGCSGLVSAANSLVGSTANDRVGDVTALANGNYVVGSGGWDGSEVNTGAATWCSGTIGCIGTVSAANSMVGSTRDESVGVVTALSDGNYVVATQGWSGTAEEAGAVTWCSGTAGCVGPILASDSLVGTTALDWIGGNGVTALPDGKYVVASINWDGEAANVGAVTWCGGPKGCAGEVVSPANSLVGSTQLDLVGGAGGGGITALPNGNYVVASPGWDGSAANVGAVTLCNGASGCSGPVSSANSLVGASGGDFVGDNSVVVLTNGNFVVGSDGWDGGASNLGAVTWCSGTTGCAGMVVSRSNSLVGSTPLDNIGGTAIMPLANGGYIVNSEYWDNPAGPILNAGAVSYGNKNGTTVGPVNASNSVRGIVPVPVPLPNGFPVSFNYTHNRMVVGRPRSNIVSIFDPSSARTPFDYDGDGKSDVSVFRASSGDWYLSRSTAGFLGLNFGSSVDRLAPADYDGDGKTDIAVYRPSTGIWYVTNSSDASVSYHVFGIEEDLPTPGDYDGDGKADISVFRPSTGTWYRTNSTDGSFTSAPFGQNGDRPTVGDFDGDGKADVAVFRPSTGAWYQLNSSDGSFFGEQFGNATDKIAPADYDGDDKTDIAIYRPSEGLWYYKNSGNGTYTPYVFGLADDVPVAADYDGDGKADIGVFRPSDGYWYIVNSSTGSFTIQPWGQSGDIPTPNAFGN